MNSGYMEIGSSKLYYEIKGQGDMLVLCHAGFLDNRMWDAQWEAFTKHYRVLRFDMRGFGRSDPVNNPVSRRQDLYLLLKKLGIKKMNLLGCSLGAELAIDCTLEHPEMVSSLILISGTPGGFEMHGEPPLQILQMLKALEQGDLEAVSELQLQLWVDGIFRKPEEIDSQVRRNAAEMNLIAVKNRTWAIADANPPDPLNPPAVKRLTEIAVPTLILAGSLDHPEILRAADLLASQIKGAKKAIISGTAHVPNLEKPAEFNQLVLNFLLDIKANKLK